MTLPRQIEDQIRRCTRCGACLEACPSYQVSGDESLAARGRVSLLEAVLDDRLGLTRGLAGRFSRCLGCRACAGVCPSGIDPHRIIAAAKAFLAAEGGFWKLSRSATAALAGTGGRPQAGLRLAGLLEAALYQKAPAASYLPYCRSGRKRVLPAPPGRSLLDMLPEISHASGGPEAGASRVILFPGCSTTAFYPETGLAAVAALNRSGNDVLSPRGLKCCGMPLLSLGEEGAARLMLENNLHILGVLDADAVVTPCPSCALSLREELPRLLGPDRSDARKLAAKVLDIHQFLASGSMAGYGTPAKTGAVAGPEEKRAARARAGMSPGDKGAGEDEITVTWHDPCHLRHGLDMTDGPREIIASIPGVRYIEMPGGQSCCGGGGLFSLKHYDMALEIGLRKAEEIAASGVQAVVTGCPSCRMHLTDMLARAGSRARIVHTVELPGEAGGAGKSS
ncbi:MAG: (Fe-S)-binding protein [Thermoleophilia bacterium]|nr:(Fe-S)-binding protein [Thermoleophilia bacterium]